MIRTLPASNNEEAFICMLSSKIKKALASHLVFRPLADGIYSLHVYHHHIYIHIIHVVVCLSIRPSVMEGQRKQFDLETREATCISLAIEH